MKFRPKSDDKYIGIDESGFRGETMKLMEKIRNRYASIAAELALLYFILAKRKNDREKITGICARAAHWLKKSEIKVPDYFEQLSCFGKLEEIEKLLVKANICAACPGM